MILVTGIKIDDYDSTPFVSITARGRRGRVLHVSTYGAWISATAQQGQ
jgi:hypothetical protein